MDCMILRSALMLALSVTLTIGTVHSQQILGPTPVLGGVQVSCGRVTTVVAPTHDLAVPDFGKQRIVLDPSVLKMRAVEQLFMYTVLCHLLMGQHSNAAECNAILRGRNQGWLKREDLKLIRDLEWKHRAPWRSDSSARCFNQGY
jgi:hypothetical protein